MWKNFMGLSRSFNGQALTGKIEKSPVKVEEKREVEN